LNIETLWAISAAVVPALFTLGTALMAFPNYGQKLAARLCFALSGIWLGVIGFMWLIHTPSPLSYRITAGVGIGLFVFVLVPLLIRVAWPLETMSQITEGTPSSPTINQGPGSAVSFGQTGGVTAGTYVNQAPPPELKFVSKDQRLEPGGNVLNEILVEVAAPYPPASLRFEVRAQNLVGGLDVVPQHTVVGLFGHSGTREGMAFATLQNPYGRILLRARTRQLEPIEFTYHFD
jgi:hypothetical protein